MFPMWKEPICLFWKNECLSFSHTHTIFESFEQWISALEYQSRGRGFESSSVFFYHFIELLNRIMVYRVIEYTPYSILHSSISSTNQVISRSLDEWETTKQAIEMQSLVSLHSPPNTYLVLSRSRYPICRETVTEQLIVEQ